jgi:small subunit ribosomal protein S5
MRNDRNKRQDRNQQPESDIKDRLVTINRVTKTTKGGRTFSFRAVVVVGDEKGKVGHGSGKSREVVTAIQKGIEDAKKQMVTIPIVNGTVPHTQEAVYSGARVLIKPASPGTGVIAGGAMRAVLESAGIKDVLAKSLGSSNTHNVVKATFLALTKMRNAADVADLRGISVHRVLNG